MFHALPAFLDNILLGQLSSWGLEIISSAARLIAFLNSFVRKKKGGRRAKQTNKKLVETFIDKKALQLLDSFSLLNREDS